MAFDKKNKVGSSYLFPATINGDRIIVYLKAKYDKGLASPNTVRDFVEPILAGEKLSKLAQEKLGANTSIENLIKEFGGEQGSKTVSFSNSSIEGLGYEPKVVGAAFGLKEGQTSKVIAGSSGLFVVKTISKTPLPEVSNPEFLIPNLDYTQKQKLSYQSLLYSMISSAEIKDNRAKNLR